MPSFGTTGRFIIGMLAIAGLIAGCVHLLLAGFAA